MLDEYHLRFLSPLERNKEFSGVAEINHLHTLYLYHIQATCTHEITRGGIHPHNPLTRTSSIMGNVSVKYPDMEGACWICGKEFGWYCPDSPDHICDYRTDAADFLDLEHCFFCGQPQERK